MPVFATPILTMLLLSAAMTPAQTPTEGPAPWTRPVTYLGAVNRNHVLVSAPETSRTGSPTIWLWIFADRHQGVGTVAADGGSGAFNIVAQNYRVDCTARTLQTLHVQTYLWDVEGDDEVRTVMSQTVFGQAQPVDAGAPNSLAVSAACDPAFLAQRRSDGYPDVSVAKLELFYAGD